MLKFKFLLPVAALMMMAVGCSDEDIVNPGNPDDGDGVTDPTADRSIDKDKEKTLINDNVAFIMSVIDNSKSIFAYEQKEDGSYVVEFSDGTKNTVTVGQSTKVVHPKLTIDENNNWVIEGKKYDYKASAEEGEKNAYPIFNLRKSNEDYYWQVRFSDDKDAYIDVLNTEDKALLANPLVEGDAARSSIISSISTENNVFSFKLQDKAMTKSLSQLGLKLVIKWENGDLDAQGYLNINGEDFKEVSLEYPDGNIASAESSDPTRWSAEISGGKLKITALINEDFEGTVTVKVSNTTGGEIAEVIKVKTNYVVPKETYYKQFYTDRKELTVGGIVLKNTAENTVTIGGETVNDIKIEKVDKATTITEGGIYFIEPEVSGLKINVTSGEYLVVIGNDPLEYSNFDFTGGMILSVEGGSYLFKNIEFNNLCGINKTNNVRLMKNAKNIVFDACSINTKLVQSDPTLHFLNIVGARPAYLKFENFIFCNSKLKLVNKTFAFVSLGANPNQIGKFELRNNVFHTNVANISSASFKLYAANQFDNGGVTEHIIDNNIFVNLIPANGYINGKIGSLNMKNNIFVQNNSAAGNYIVLKRKDGDTAGYSGLTGIVQDNIGYIPGEAQWILNAGGTTGGDGFAQIEDLTASPFESFNFTDGTYVLKSEYSQYGPQK